MSEEVGRLTPIDIAINKLITTSNKLKVTDGEQIRKILMDIKNYERLEIGRAHSTGFNRLWWDKEMNFQYYENEYGNIQCTKESRSTKDTDSAGTEEPLGGLQEVRKSEPIPDRRLGGSKSSTSNPEEGTSNYSKRVRGILLSE